MVINNRPVSDNILRIISERGYKQSAVARKAGYSRQTFGYMVHNTRIIIRYPAPNAGNNLR